MPGTNIKHRGRSEQQLLAAARGGDEGALRHVLETHCTDLHAHCYRMLGSAHDAEDALQDALLRAWRGLPRFEGRSAFRTWLYRIATNACLDLIERRPQRVLPVDYGPSGDDMATGVRRRRSLGVEPYPVGEVGFEADDASPEASYERREAVELAFIAALQHLPPRQRAVLMLRDVLGFSAKETARALATTLVSVNSALQRARRTIDELLLEQSRLAGLRSFRDEGAREFVARLMDAFEGTDVDALLSLLVEDVNLHYRPRQRESALGHSQPELPGTSMKKGKANEQIRRHQQHHPRRRDAGSGAARRGHSRRL